MNANGHAVMNNIDVARANVSQVKITRPLPREVKQWLRLGRNAYQGDTSIKFGKMERGNSGIDFQSKNIIMK